MIRLISRIAIGGGLLVVVFALAWPVFAQDGAHAHDTTHDHEGIYAPAQHTHPAPDLSGLEARVTALETLHTTQCNDGNDNDQDGTVDWDGGGVAQPDRGCTDASDDDESDDATISAPNELVLMDFEDGVLRDLDWLRSQPQGGAELYISDKTDGFNRTPLTFSIAQGEGYGGGNALRVTLDESSDGVPGIWFVKLTTGSAQRVNDCNKYLVPCPDDYRGNWNRLQFKVKFRVGFRAVDSERQPPEYPNHQNFHLGTYNVDPATLPSNAVETHGQHFYHQTWFRHQQKDGEWSVVTFNRCPSHKRSISALPPCNPSVGGDYYEVMTRFYLEWAIQNADPEVQFPYDVLIDDVKLLQVPEETIVLDVVGEERGAFHSLPAETPTAFEVIVSNPTAEERCGSLLDASFWRVRVTLTDANSLDAFDTLCLAAGEQRTYTWQIAPDEEIIGGSTFWTGIVWSPADQHNSGADYSERSFSDAAIERRWMSSLGPHDAERLASDFLRIRAE